MLLILLLALAGLALSGYLYWTQITHRQLRCLLGGSCDLVIKSRYNHWFGLPTEVLGLFYYTALASGAGLRLSGVTTIIWPLPLLLLIAATLAALFSIVLMLIQWLALKKFCEYCTLSALISLAIFGLLWWQF